MISFNLDCDFYRSLRNRFATTISHGTDCVSRTASLKDTQTFCTSSRDCRWSVSCRDAIQHGGPTTTTRPSTTLVHPPVWRPSIGAMTRSHSTSLILHQPSSPTQKLSCRQPGCSPRLASTCFVCREWSTSSGCTEPMLVITSGGRFNARVDHGAWTDEWREMPGNCVAVRIETVCEYITLVCDWCQ